MFYFFGMPRADDLFSNPLRWASSHLLAYAATAILATACFFFVAAVYSFVLPHLASSSVGPQPATVSSEMRPPVQTLPNGGSREEKAANESSKTESPAAIFSNADIVVKAVIAILCFASLVSWTIWIAKLFELRILTRMARSQLDTLIFRDFSDFQLRHWQGDVGQIVRQVATERELSGSEPSEGFERRTTLRIKHVQYVAQRSRAIGVPLLLIISLIAPFVGLFGSLFALLGWLTTLTDVHPMSATSPATPFAEALLTLEVGMMAAIPASACYFHLRHKLENYYALLNEAATHVILIVSRNQEKSVAQRNRNGRVSA